MASLPSSVLPKHLAPPVKRGHVVELSPKLARAASRSADEVVADLSSTMEGLAEEEAVRRLEEFGPNIVAEEQRYTRLKLLVRACANPLVVLLTVLAVVSFATAQDTSDYVGGALMVAMVVLGVSLRFIQEARADAAAAKLKAMIRVTATVMREGSAHELALAELVPGDIVKLAAGDMIPADVRILSCKDLFLTQASLTGESFPVEKFDRPEPHTARSPLDLPNVCFLARASRAVRLPR